MEELATAIGGLFLGAASWVIGNLMGAVGYVLTIVLILPIILVAVLIGELWANVRRRLRGEPPKPFRWR